ncbi:hypothetical protein BDW02DRAFT_570034 [Decorospora gaudefroyi]|uniref:Uncharacterized protein n=1 Tax=Decorospora gaudefroyi TaxID=184978 RepID=A0A6A5KJ52_9PLEO|nr:hypothetical protein BDW02DRAFT_570034 [Decorospora gaudefroyi]
MVGQKRAIEAAIDSGSSADTGHRRKRARKVVANDESPLLRLAGELRNHIYELIIADQAEDASNRYGATPLKHTSIKSRKRFRAASHWAAAHKDRAYMGLTQVCQLFRREFRPLYFPTLSVSVAPTDFGKLLSVFGLNHGTRDMGDFIDKNSVAVGDLHRLLDDEKLPGLDYLHVYLHGPPKFRHGPCFPNRAKRFDPALEIRVACNLY